MMINAVKYQNESGLSLCFRNKKPYYFEKVDATSLSGNFTSDTLARAPGQITVYKNIAARTVVCDFAIWLTDEKDKTNELMCIANLFNPTENGTLTITTDKAVYDIECYPSTIPTITKDNKVYSVYRFTVDFICDYPYFRQLGKISKSLASGTNVINSLSIPDTPIEIYIPDCSNGAEISFVNKLGINSIKMLAVDGAVTINTETFTAIAYNGNDVTNKIDLSSKIENCKLTYGKNTITLSNVSEAKINYYNLAVGVV